MKKEVSQTGLRPQPEFKRNGLSAAISAAVLSAAVVSTPVQAGIAAPVVINGTGYYGSTPSNSGTVEDVWVMGAISSLTNSGVITSDSDDIAQVTAASQEIALLITADVGSVINSGSITMDPSSPPSMGGSPGVVSITSTNGIPLVVDSFSNTGLIDGRPGSGVTLSGVNMQSFTNSGDGVSTGIIRGAGSGVILSDAPGAPLPPPGPTSTPFLFSTGPMGFIGTSIGSFSNSGLIEGESVAGVMVGMSSDVDALTNSGTIRGGFSGIALGMGSVDTLTNEAAGVIEGGRYGIDMGVLSGAVINRGDILAGYMTSVSEAYGIRVNSDVTGNIINSGTIDARASSSNSTEAYGIGIQGAISNTGSVLIEAGGQINATVYTTDDDTAEAYGIRVSGNVEGLITIESSGSIDVSATNTYSDATAYGIYVGSDLTGTISNAGAISVDASAPDSDVYGATGIYISGDVSSDGLIRNSGSIDIMIHAAEDNGEGAGIAVVNEMAGTIENSGRITLRSTVNGYGEDTDFAGIHLNTLSGTLTNTSSGMIDVSRTVFDSSSSAAIGIYADDVTGTLNNHGSIQVGVEGTSYTATGFGLYIDAVGAAGVVNNSGSIVVNAVNEAEAIGVAIGTLGGVFNNSGTIRASHDQGWYQDSVYIYSGSGTFNNQAGGLLVGGFEVRGGVTVNNHGTLSIPENQYGYVQGDYNQSAGGVLRIGASSAPNMMLLRGGPTGYSSLRVDGTATFAAGSGIDVDVAAVNTLVVDDELLNVISAGTLVASSFNVTDNSALLDFSAIVDGNTVDLVAIEGTTIAETVEPTGNPALGGAANRLDNAGSGMGGTVSELNKLGSGQEVADAVESLTPTFSGAMARLTNLGLNNIRNIIRLRQGGRGMPSGDQFLTDGHFWVKPFGSWADQDDRQGVTGYEIDQQGLVLGVDGYISSDWELGVAFGYSMSDVDSSLAMGNHSVEIDSYQAKLYATYHLDSATAINLQLGSGVSQYDSKRRIFTGDVASADYDGWSLQASAEFERSYALSEATTLTPYLFMDYSYVDVDSYREKGAGANSLHVNGDNDDALIVGLGAKLEHAFTDQLLLQLDMDAGYDLEADQTRLTAGFAGDAGATFTTVGMEPDVLVYNVGTGVQYRTESGVEMTLRYDLNGREDYRDQSVSANFRWAF